MPTAKKYAFARWLTVRRVNYQMAVSYSNIKIARDEQGRTITQNEQLGFDYEGDVHYEGELFDEDGMFPFAETRDDLFQRDMMSQEAFNSFLEHAFLDSQRWYEENGATGRKLFKKESPAFTFFNGDRDVFQSLQAKYKQSA
jgi:hypothetical protein